MLAQVVQTMHSAGIDVALADVRQPVSRMARRAGLARRLGEDRIFHTIDEAVRALGRGDAALVKSRDGERVCLFTVGLVEARRRGEHLARVHLRSLVEQGLSAQAIVERTESDSDLCNDGLAVVVLGRATVVAPRSVRARRRRRPSNGPPQAAIEVGIASNATVRFRPARLAV